MSGEDNQTLQFLGAVLDSGTFRRWSAPADPTVADDSYQASLTRAAERSGLDESVMGGEGLLAGRRVAILCGDFAFMGGSVGVSAAECIVATIERATRERLPLLAATASGGTRMQEGTLAFTRMIAISGAISAHRRAGLPYLVYLRHPTTGGVLASWGSLGQITYAEPGAMIGFVGPKVVEALCGTTLPAGVQTAEALERHGVVDAAVPLDGLKDAWAQALTVLTADDADAERPGGRSVCCDVTEPSDWEAVRRSRDPRRPGIRELLAAATAVTRLGGTGEGERAGGVVVALARIAGISCVVVGHNRGAGSVGPGGLRTARRGMRLAEEVGLPLVSLVDTAGAELSAQAEFGALAGEIARCLSTMHDLVVPTISVLLGEGGGGAALALLPADRVLAARYSWLGPLPPEGAAAIRFGDPARADEVAFEQQIGSTHLLRNGLVDRIVDECVAGADTRAFSEWLVVVIGDELRRLRDVQDTERIAARRRRYRWVGGCSE